MGIKNLFKLIKKFAPNSIQYNSITDYKYKYIVLDANMIIYQYVIAIRNSGKDLCNDKGQITSHILGVISKSLMLLKNKIIPIYIFDGKAPKLKLSTINKRKKLKDKNVKKLSECSDEKEKIKYFKRSFYLKNEQILEVKNVLQLLGIPTITSNSEADPLCAKFVKKNLAYGVSSEDMDLLTFGCPILIRKLKKGKKNSIIEIHLNKVLDELNLNMNQFIDLCILLGSDYLPSIKKIGPNKAYNIIKKYKSIETFLSEDIKVKNNYFEIPEKYNYKLVQNFFKNPPINDVKIKKIKYNNPRFDKFYDLMYFNFNFEKSKIDKYINLFKKYYRELKL